VKALDIIRDAGQPGAVLVASHNAGISEALAKFVKGADPLHQIGVVGFAEKMPTTVIDLKSEGLLLLDLERDCHAFKKPLKRSLGYNLDDISAQEIL
jgi:hypothetical protein